MRACVVLGIVFFIQAKRLAWGNVSEVTCHHRVYVPQAVLMFQATVVLIGSVIVSVIGVQITESVYRCLSTGTTWSGWHGRPTGPSSQLLQASVLFTRSN